MARERISLIPEEAKKETSLRQQILNGEITPTQFAAMSPAEQSEVNKVLFKIASEKVEPTVGTSALEFILFGFMRIANKKLQGMSLTAEDAAIETSLNNILGIHEITDGITPKANWLFDYMGYAELKALEFLQNREDHIVRKRNITGQV